MFADAAPPPSTARASDADSPARRCGATSVSVRAILERHGAPSRSSSATRSWPSSACRAAARTTRCAPSGRRSRCRRRMPGRQRGLTARSRGLGIEQRIGVNTGGGRRGRRDARPAAGHRRRGQRGRAARAGRRPGRGAARRADAAPGARARSRSSRCEPLSLKGKARVRPCVPAGEGAPRRPPAPTARTRRWSAGTPSCGAAGGVARRRDGGRPGAHGHDPRRRRRRQDAPHRGVPRRRRRQGRACSAAAASRTARASPSCRWSRSCARRRGSAATTPSPRRARSSRRPPAGSRRTWSSASRR